MIPLTSLDNYFPVGYYHFHKKQLFNFQLNRLYSLGFADLSDLEDIGKKIRSFSDWKKTMIKLAEEAESSGLFLKASMYYRAAEFYLLEDTAEKNFLYKKYSDNFDQATKNEQMEKFRIPYDNAYLPALLFTPTIAKKGTIIFHGGFDSFIEEFFFMLKFFSNQGYEIIAFEGPGQGAARREYGLAFDIEWEKPVKSILDYFTLNESALIGMSMGGWLCLRAAAYEPRISNVIASGHAIDYMKSMNVFLYRIHQWFLKHRRDFMAKMAEKKFKGGKDSIPIWMVKHLMYITKKDNPLDALEIYVNMNQENMQCSSITQNVLLLLGEKDHFIPLKMLDMQVKALENAKSVTTRIFRREDHAQNHCQVGNIGLSLEVMKSWLDEKFRSTQVSQVQDEKS